jgi:alpha-1,2-mannosyltransferase
MAANAWTSRIVPLAWLTGSAFAIILFASDLITFQKSHGISINGSAIWGRDFANVWSAGRLAIEGQTAILYDMKAYQAWQDAAFGWGINDHNYSYPPLTLLYAPLFGAMPYFAALALWSGVSLAAFFWAARPWLARAQLPAVAAVALPSSLVCLWAGHYGLLLGALWLGAWRLIDRSPIVAGVLTGLMAVKPHLAILMPLMLILRGEWRAIGAAALTVGLLVGVSAAVFGPEQWHVYVMRTSGHQVGLVDATHTFFIKMMPTLTPALFAAGFDSIFVWAAQAGLALAAIFALWRFQPEDSMTAGLAAAVATFLVLPYGFNYDLTVVGLAAALAMHKAGRDGRVWATAIAALAFVLPSTLIHLNRNGLWIAPLVLAMFLAVLLRKPSAT